MSEMPHIDLEHLEKYVVGDASLRDEILSIFYDQAETLTARLDADAGDEEWKDATHALKGASRGVGAWRLGDLCEEAEELVGEYQSKVSKRTALLDAIRTQTARALEEVVLLRAAA